MGTAASGGNAKDGFGQWLSERPKWLQTAAARLAATRKLPLRHSVGAQGDDLSGVLRG